MNKDTAQIQKHNLPRHVAITMDGNGRWAKKRGAKRIFGHRNAIQAVREASEGCAELGVEYLTLYTFSTENWKRPKSEVSALVELLIQTIRKEMDILQKNDIVFDVMGDVGKFSEECRLNIKNAVEETRGNNGMHLTLALNYSGRWEILEACKKILAQASEIETNKFTEDHFVHFLDKPNIPDPELLIRTSGEQRISNFFLWQVAYTELYFTPVLWPDFTKKDLYKAIIDYQSRERRFGKV